MFFVLSGRLMADVLFVQKAELGGWALRRFARLVPALWFFLAVIVVADLTVMNWSVPPRDGAIAGSFLINYWQGQQAAPEINHVWSLCIEAHCYVVLAAVAWFGRDLPERSIAILLLALAAAAMASGAIQSELFDRGYYEVYWRSDTRGASILMSAGVFLLLRNVSTRWLFLICAPLGFALQSHLVPDAIKYTLGTTALAIAVCSSQDAPKVLRACLSNPVLCWFGLTSYSLYLWQQPFAKAELPWQAALPAAVMAGAASYYAVEKPLRKLIVRRRSGVPAQAGAGGGR